MPRDLCRIINHKLRNRQLMAIADKKNIIKLKALLVIKFYYAGELFELLLSGTLVERRRVFLHLIDQKLTCRRHSCLLLSQQKLCIRITR